MIRLAIIVGSVMGAMLLAAGMVTIMKVADAVRWEWVAVCRRIAFMSAVTAWMLFG